MTDALKLAKDAYDASTTYVNANYRKQWETNLRLFQSKHPSGSKYLTEAYKYRSRIFRPKTRSAVRRLEAATAAAFFSNVDVINCDAEDQKNPQQVDAAKAQKAMLQYRLTKTIPWFVTLLGGMQDAATVGVVCSYQCWNYKEKKVKQPVLDEQGQPLMDFDGKPVTQEVAKVLQDEPSITLVALENLRISPAAKWYDPVGTSPYLIELMPMYVCDVKEMMTRKDPKTGEPAWKKLDDGVLQTALKNSYDSTRQIREGNRQDSTQPAESITDFDIVWVHRNIMRQDGEDVIFYTLGTEKLLTDPRPLGDLYKTGERPYVMGVCVLETHKIYPSAPVELGAPVQQEINQVTNSRLDNVQLVLNKRYLVKRGAQADLKSLTKNVAGSITMVNDVEKDIRELEFSDVTASSFQEQDRLSVEHDDVVGAFSQASVMNNRKLNETVGGMGLLNQSANSMTEYTIRLATETWIEPVLRQVAKLEAAYETDEVILNIVGKRAGLEGPVTQEHLNTDLTLTVNVGMGATDPNTRLGKLTHAVQVVGEMYAIEAPGMNKEEIAKEVFGISGYRDGARFLLDSENPIVDQAKQAAQAEIKKAQEQIQQAAKEAQQEKAEAAQETEKVRAAKEKLQQDDINFQKKLLEEEKALQERENKLALREIALDAKEELHGITKHVAGETLQNKQKVHQDGMAAEKHRVATEKKAHDAAAKETETKLLAQVESSIAPALKLVATNVEKLAKKVEDMDEDATVAAERIDDAAGRLVAMEYTKKSGKKQRVAVNRKK